MNVDMEENIYVVAARKRKSWNNSCSPRIGRRSGRLLFHKTPQVGSVFVSHSKVFYLDRFHSI